MTLPYIVHRTNRIYSHWLRAYTTHHAECSESPVTYHFWTGVSTIAGALRRRVWIDQKDFQWTPNFYIVLVGPPGIVAKSTSIRCGTSLLQQIPGVTIGPQSATWQALTQALEEAQEAVQVPGETKLRIMSCLTLSISELGTLIRPDNRELLDVLISLWDGQIEDWGRRTKTQGTTIILNPWLNIIGCTTPAWLRDNFPDVLIGGGFASRILFVYADQKRQLIAYPDDIVPSAEYRQGRENLLRDLHQIASLAGEFILTPEARAYGRAWYEQHWNGPRAAEVSSASFQSYWARKQTHVHKLAMVLSAAQRDDLSITREDLEEAVAQITSLEGNLQKVFTSIGVAPSAKVTVDVLAFIENVGEVKYKELWEHFHHTMDTDLLNRALRDARKAGYLRTAEKNGEAVITYTGRKT